MDDSDRRMIEHEIPLKAVNFASGKEKKHPRRHVELIHQWPARRPRSACRVAIAAALLRVPKSEADFKARLKLLEDLAPYECSNAALEEARKLIRAEHGGRAPKVLDMFAGGGAIPLEAANLGCEAHAVELNPVAHIIELATCVYPQNYGTKLADLVEKWGKVVLDEVRNEIGDLYPSVRLKGKRGARQLVFAGESAADDGSKFFEPIAYLWTRTVPCVNRDCGATVPLVRQTWLCRNLGRYVALKLVTDRSKNEVRFEIVSASSQEGIGFDPAAFSEGGDAECLFCGAAISAAKTKEYGKRGMIGSQLMAAAGTVDGERGRVYLPAESIQSPSVATLRDRLAEFGDEWPGPAALALAPNDGGGSCALYGLDQYWKLFTDRQAVALLTFSKAIARCHDRLTESAVDRGLADAVVTYLGLALDKVADYGCSIATWEATDQVVKQGLRRQHPPIVWDFAEVNPCARISGAFPLTLEAEVFAIRGLAAVPQGVTCTRTSATDLPIVSGTIDAVITDPPYYGSMAYADLADFFFVWMKRTLGATYPDHLGADETPKREEATFTPHRHDGDEARASAHYERLMTLALVEAGRVTRPGGPVVVVYAHKTVAGWAALVDAMRRAACEVTEAWPLHTESDIRLRARDSAALATSIFLVARKRRSDVNCDDYDDILLEDVSSVIAERVRTLWKAGLTGADLAIAVVGAALGPFTHYSMVRRANGKEVTTQQFLDDAQRMALDAVLRQVVRDAVGREVSVAGIDPISRLYVVSQMQFGETAADYDSFKNLAIGALPPGTELDGLKGALMQGKSALLAKKGGKVAIRGFRDRGDANDLGLIKDGKAPPLVDVLHRLLWLQLNRPADIPTYLRESQADLESVRLLAQALGGRPLRAEPRPGAQKDERTDEQRAIDTFLASFQDLTRRASLSPLFERKNRVDEDAR